MIHGLGNLISADFGHITFVWPLRLNRAPGKRLTIRTTCIMLFFFSFELSHVSGGCSNWYSRVGDIQTAFDERWM